MAQTKKKRRRKHRGTQGGRVDTRPRKPQNRAEARQRAKTRKSSGSSSRKRPAAGMGSRQLEPPSWGGAIKKGGLAAVFFFVLIAFVFGRGPAGAAGISALMLLFYVPMSYFVDTFFFNRQLRKAEQERNKSQQGG